MTKRLTVMPTLAFGLLIGGFALATTAWTPDAVAQSPMVPTGGAVILRAPDAGEVRALVIGIDAYRYVRPLKGAVADAQDLEGSLRRTGVRDIVTLIDGQADRASVLRQIEALLQRTRAGDLVFLSIAGHGAQEPERVKGSQPDGMDDVFLLPGFDPKTSAGAQQKLIGQEFNHFIKQFEAKSARVIFVADTCHGGGLTREIDPRADEMSYRQVARYAIIADDLRPVSSPDEAFLTELDFEHTTFLAAVDRKTKAPEVRIPGVPGWRGALSYAMARAIEGGADANHDQKVTLKELFSHVRQVVYQLSDQRQNVVTETSPNRDLDTDVAFMTRSVKVIEGPTLPSTRPGQDSAPARPRPPSAAAVRIASLDGQRSRLAAVVQRESPFQIVAPKEGPDLVWDPATGDVLAGGDVISYQADERDLAAIVDRTAAINEFKKLGTRAPQQIRTLPNDRLQHKDSKIEIEVGDVKDRALIVFNIAGNGTVQPLYPVGSDSWVLRATSHRLSVRVKEPFGADQIIVITSVERMNAIEQVMRQMGQLRNPVSILRLVERYAPQDARIGTTGLFTAP